MSILPQSRSGKLAVGLMAADILLVATHALNYPYLAQIINITAALGSSVFGLIAIFKSKDHAVLVVVVTALGLISATFPLWFVLLKPRG